MSNLDELWHYEDETDRWAAAREYELRARRYEIAREGVLGIVKRATTAFRDFQEALAGINAAASLPTDRDARIRAPR